MFGSSNVKRKSTVSADIETIIGKSTVFKGEISGEGNVRIDGVMEGEISSSGDVIVGENGSIKASIKAQNILISGDVTGNVTASNKLEIAPTGKLTGDVSAVILSIAEGAAFKGSSNMESAGKNAAAEAVIQSNEKKK